MVSAARGPRELFGRWRAQPLEARVLRRRLAQLLRRLLAEGRPALRLAQKPLARRKLLLAPKAKVGGRCVCRASLREEEEEEEDEKS